MEYIDNGCISTSNTHLIALALNNKGASAVDLNIDLNYVYCIENQEGLLILHSYKRIDLTGWKKLWEFLGESQDMVENCVPTRYRD